MNDLTLFDGLRYKRRGATLQETAMGLQRAAVLEALVDLQLGDPVGHHAFSIQTRLIDPNSTPHLPKIERNAIGSRLAELEDWYGFVLELGKEYVEQTVASEKTYVPTAEGAEWVRIQRQLRAAA